MLDLAGKTVVITGAGGGIGTHLVNTFSAAGAVVVACDRSEDWLASLDAAHKQYFDLTDSAGTRQAAEDIIRGVLGEVHTGHDENELAAKVTRDDLVPQALAQLAAGGIAVSEFALAQPSLDDVFLALTGKPVESDETVNGSKN